MQCQDGIDKYKIFESLHKGQLESSGVPNIYWRSLFKKIENNIFDAGTVFSMFKIDSEGNETKNTKYTVLVTEENGIHCDDASQIYLIDHAWTYESNKAVENLIHVPGLLNRMCNLMGVPIENDCNKNIENVCREMWCYNQTYSQGFGNMESRIPVWYIMDEFGSAIEHSDEPNFRTVPFYYINDGITYSLLFPILDTEYWGKVTRDYLDGLFKEQELMRKACMLPWKHSLFLDISYIALEPPPEYFQTQLINETLPIVQNTNMFHNKRVLKVYSEYELINRYLTHPDFELVDDYAAADILWLTKHFTDYKGLSENSPGKFINQFPFESVLTMKNLLSAVCKRAKQKDAEGFEDNPLWLPKTYDLNNELVKFVSYFQHLEENGLNNLWICKPWNLARGLDVTITNNIKCIVRLPLTGPKIAQKYIHNPVLFNREDVGLVKFDIRFVILLKSVKPLSLFAYKKFFLRFANKPFDFKDFSDKEKHFTVMNYDPRTPLFKMLCDEFIEKFNKQYEEYSWYEIEEDIFKAIKEIFEAAALKPPPCGIGHNMQSRALYSVDLMLARESNGRVQPKILEVNWLSCCERACQYYSSFFNDIFLLLFKMEFDSSKFQQL